MERTVIHPPLDQSASWNDQRRCPLSASEVIATKSFDVYKIQAVIAHLVTHQRAILADGGARDWDPSAFR
jgi:hypothetical protein